MLKIAVLGSRETVMGFKALGLEVFPVEGADEARAEFKKLTHSRDEYAIIYIEEDLSLELRHEIDKLKDLPTPAVILIPGPGGSLARRKKPFLSLIQQHVDYT